MRRIPIRLQGLTQSPYCTTPLEKHTLFSNLNKHLFSLGQIAPLIGKSYFCFEGSCRAPNKRRNCSLSCQCHPLPVLTKAVLLFPSKEGKRGCCPFKQELAHRNSIVRFLQTLVGIPTIDLILRKIASKRVPKKKAPFSYECSYFLG